LPEWDKSTGVSKEGIVQTFNGSVFSIEMHRDEHEQNMNKYERNIEIWRE
jgi:hypothetical protein